MVPRSWNFTDDERCPHPRQGIEKRFDFQFYLFFFFLISNKGTFLLPPLVQKGRDCPNTIYKCDWLGKTALWTGIIYLLACRNRCCVRWPQRVFLSVLFVMTLKWSLEVKTDHSVYYGLTSTLRATVRATDVPAVESPWPASSFSVTGTKSPPVQPIMESRCHLSTQLKTLIID